MKADRIINAELIREIALLGHTQKLAIADAGLPVPSGVKLIDISLVRGIPAFRDVLNAVLSELVVEGYIMAGETVGQPAEKQIRDIMGQIPGRIVSHETLKQLLNDCSAVIKTGEVTSYANIILIGGVNF